MNTLLADDPALPQRDLLVDEAVMAEYLARLIARYGDFSITDCQRLRTKYRVGASLRVLYQIRGSGHSYRIAARAFPRAHRIANQFTSTPEIYAPELNTIFWVFPHDRKIRNLVVLSGIPAELCEIEGREWVESRIVGHVPEKSVTAQCLDQQRKVLAYAKVYAGEEGHDVYDLYQELNAALGSDAGPLRLPRALSYSNKHHLLLLESVPGAPLSALSAAHRERAYFRFGEALRKLHSIQPPASTLKSTRLTPKGLAQAAATISEVRPEVAGMVQRLTGKLIAAGEEIEKSKPVLLHGDLHPKNVLTDGEELCLLDLDQAATGAAALDLGSVIAGLYCERCLDLLSAKQSASLVRAFLNGYGFSPRSQKSLRWHIAAALLEERALRAVTRIRFGGIQKLPVILLTAEAVLAGGTLAN